MKNSVSHQIGGYIIEQMIGRGSFSSVYQAVHEQTGQIVALKAISKSKTSRETFEAEVNIMQSIDHPFCVSFFESLEDENNFYIIMEYVEGKTLLKLINMHKGIPEWQAQHYFCQLISVLDYLHNDLRITHRDIKTENIIVDNYGNIRLIDFGLGNILKTPRGVQTDACGSLSYAPPEMLRNLPYTSAADIWSTGVVLYSMLAGHPPFYGEDLKQLARSIVKDEPKYPNDLPSLAVDLLRRILIKDASFRISVRKIMDHSWFKNYPSSYLMDSKFGSFQGYRLYYPPEQSVMKRLMELHLDAEEQYDAVQMREFGPKATAYRVLHRKVTAQKMRSLYTTAEENSTQRLQFALPHGSTGSLGPRISNARSTSGIRLSDSRSSGLHIGHSTMLLLSSNQRDGSGMRRGLPMNTPAVQTMHQIPAINSSFA